MTSELGLMRNFSDLGLAARSNYIYPNYYTYLFLTHLNLLLTSLDNRCFQYH